METCNFQASIFQSSSSVSIGIENMGACGSSLIPVAIAVEDTKQLPVSEPSTGIMSPDKVPMTEHLDPRVVDTINNMVTKDTRINKNGKKKLRLDMLDLEGSIRRLFGADYTNSLVNTAAIIRLFTDAGWKYVKCEVYNLAVCFEE